MKPKNTGVGSLSLLQEIFPTQESNQGLLHCRQILYQLSYQGSPNSPARDWTSIPCTGRWHLKYWTTRKPVWNNMPSLCFGRRRNLFFLSITVGGNGEYFIITCIIFILPHLKCSLFWYLMSYQTYSQSVSTGLHNHKYEWKYMNFTENCNDYVKNCCILR